jgi:hypothetical protein
VIPDDQPRGGNKAWLFAAEIKLISCIFQYILLKENHL